jgi:hypothetical protein
MMNRLRFCASLTVALAFAAPALPALDGALGTSPALAKATKVKMKDPETVIRTIYSQYSKEAGPAEAEQQNFSADLYKLYIEAQQGGDQADDVGIDFDVFLDAQDLDAITDVTTKFTAAGDDKGTVVAKFTAFGKKKAITYAMVKTPKGWKIDNISWGAGRADLRTMLAELKAEHTKSQ